MHSTQLYSKETHTVVGKQNKIESFGNCSNKSTVMAQRPNSVKASPQRQWHDSHLVSRIYHDEHWHHTEKQHILLQIYLGGVTLLDTLHIY